MAFPVILVNSATGSDSAASGAGPGTALTGTNASTSGDGLTVTLDGSPDLSGVATDGSHVIYLADTTAGARNFGKITAVDNGAKTVTVSDAFGLSLTGTSWAIGGKRASVGSTTSVKLFSNNSAAGDAMPGWIVEMESAHAESVSTGIVLRRAGNLTDGPIILRGTSGAATRPAITATANINVFTLNTAHQQLADFEIIAGAATVAGGVAGTGADSVVRGLKLSRTSTNVFTTGIGTLTLVIGCEVQRCTTGINITTENAAAINNYVHDCTGTGINGGNMLAVGNLVVDCADGIVSSATGGANRAVLFAQNTVESCTSAGIKLTSAPVAGNSPLLILNNILSNNGTYGVQFSHVSATLPAVQAMGWQIRNNNTFNNTTAAYLPTGAGDDDPGLDPQYTNAAGADYSIGTNLKAKGYPLGGTAFVGLGSATYSYTDIGAAQRQEAGGSGGLLRHPGMAGGLLG